MLRSSLSLLLLSTLLWGCAGAQEQEAANESSQGPKIAAEVAPEPPERAFPQDSIYPLLVAEFALRRRNRCSDIRALTHIGARKDGGSSELSKLGSAGFARFFTEVANDDRSPRARE